MSKAIKRIIWIVGIALVPIIVLFIILARNQDGNTPKSGIAKKWAENTIIPFSIEEVESAHGITPEIEVGNGEMIIFTNSDGDGWLLNEEDELSWEFAKLPKGFNQSLSVGYIRDKTVYGPISYYEEMEGEFTIKADTEGVYYIYCLGTSSDPITLKEGEIKVKE